MNEDMFEYYKNVLKDYRPYILNAEKIKQDPEFKRMLKYFQRLKERGQIKVAPSERNNYRLVR